MANMQNVLNTIRANASEMYQNRVPEATKTNLDAVGVSIMSHNPTMNEFLSMLVNKIAMQIVHSKTFNNPLAVLKKGSVPLGKDIEEIYTNPATAQVFDPTGETLFKRSVPDTKVIYHSMNRQDKYKATISMAMLQSAFMSYEALEKLLSTIVNSIYSGDNIDEFMLMKQLFGTAIAGNKIKKMDVGNVTDADSAREFIKAVKTVGTDMSFPSSSYNTYYDVNKDTDAKPVITWTPIENQVLILRNDISVQADVELFANAFNVSYTDLKQRTLIVDGFGTATNCGAVLCDEAFIQVYDNLKQMGSVDNVDGLYQNHIYHHWQTYSMSLFANAMAFMLPESEGESEGEEVTP